MSRFAILALLRNLFPRSADRPRQRPRRTLLEIESLEDRLAPAAVNFAVTQDWGSGFQAAMSIVNSPSAPTVANWQLAFDYSANISDIWDAKIISHVGTHYLIGNAGWNADIAPGATETFGFNASPGKTTATPSNYLLDGVALGGSTPNLPTLSIGSTSITAGNSGGTAAFTVSLSAASPVPVTVHYATQNGTASASSDYQAVSGTLTFAPGQTSQTIAVPIPAETAAKPNETFSVLLSNPISATLAQASATGTIIDNYVPTAPGGVQFTVSSDWGSGFTGNVTIPNNTGNTLTNWTLSFTFNGQISSIWNATIVSQSGNQFVVQGASWNSTIVAGGSTSFGFNGSPGGGAEALTNFVLQAGTVTPPPVTPPPATPPTTPPTTPPSSPAASTWPSQVFAPYVDMTLYPTYNLVNAAQTLGVKYFTLAFIVADSSGAPSWGGYSSYDVNGGDFDQALRTQISNLRAIGGDVMVSFGGAANQELAQVITNVASLTNAYQTVINAYQLTQIDFDIEGAAVADHASIDRRSQAIANLQANAAAAGKPLDVWFTLPALPTGLTADGLYVLQSALKYGVKITGVNVMAMDYGDGAAPNPAGQMGTYAIEAGTSLFTQLRTLYGSGPSDAQLWAMVGVSPMIGVNDQSDEVFNQAAAQQLLTWAQQKGVGRLSMWSLNRDQQDPAGALTYANATSSSLLQQPGEFSSIFEAFTK